jgi:hypothetical protein
MTEVAETSAAFRGLPAVRAMREQKVSIETGEGTLEHRQYPRARITVPVRVWIGEGKEQTFSATLRTANISVSGAFLESTFFLKLGTELSLRFELDEDGESVLGRAQVVREERPARGDDGGRTGMGIRFVAFEAQSEVTLARLFLGDTLREFAAEFLGSARAKSLGSEFERVVDSLAAWELARVTRNTDPWQLGEMATVPTPAPQRGRGR